MALLLSCAYYWSEKKSHATFPIVSTNLGKRVPNHKMKNTICTLFLYNLSNCNSNYLHLVKDNTMQSFNGNLNTILQILSYFHFWISLLVCVRVRTPSWVFGSHHVRNVTCVSYLSQNIVSNRCFTNNFHFW